MNEAKLQQAEKRFLDKYPTGFMHPEFEKIEKQHKMSKMIEFSQENFAKFCFSKSKDVVDNMTTTISRASMVSVFEKPKFKDFTTNLSTYNEEKMADSLKEFLHGNQQRGFEDLVAVLATGKLARWPLVTIIPNYVQPNDEVFIKPTTAKGVIDVFELTNLVYKPTPTWDFYQGYRAEILNMKSKVDASLTPNNAAFCGFLMMSLDN